MRTTFTRDFEVSSSSDTTPTQNPPKSGEEEVTKWPVKIKYRKKVFARIYRPCKGRESYRVSWKAVGKRQMKSFRTYAGEDGAKKFADKLVQDLGKETPVTRLTSAQADDALAAIGLLNSFCVDTARRVSLVAAVSDYCQAAKKLHGRTLSEAVAGFMQNVATVSSKNIGEAVTEFLAGREHLTHAAVGKRSQLSPKYAYIRELQLRRFADTFAGHAVCDLTKAHLDTFISTLGEQKTKSRNHRKVTSAKSRNHYRATVRQFLDWAVRKDYLSVTHRLGEADGLRPERANTSEIEFYSPAEFEALLTAAKDKFLPLRPIIAIGGFCGLRTAELLRLDWANVWHVKGHIEVTTGTAKTRARRLVEICPALAAWLKPYRTNESGKLWEGHEVTFQQHFVELCQQAVVKIKGKEVAVARKNNGLRHAYCTYHFALHSNENLTAAQSGNTPVVIHGHYKGLATKADAEKWFNVMPAQAAGDDPVPPKSAAKARKPARRHQEKLPAL